MDEMFDGTAFRISNRVQMLLGIGLDSAKTEYHTSEVLGVLTQA